MTQQTEQLPGIRWGRALAGGVLIELVLMAVSVPFLAMDRAEELPKLVLPATVIAALLAGWWVARRVEQAVLNGALAGLAAILIYLLIAIIGALAAPEQTDMSTALSPAYLASHALKVLGGMAGAWLAARGRADNTGS